VLTTLSFLVFFFFEGWKQQYMQSRKFMLAKLQKTNLLILNSAGVVQCSAAKNFCLKRRKGKIKRFKERIKPSLVERCMT